MKRTNLKMAVLLVVFITGFTFANAQRNECSGNGMKMLDLTDTQQKAVDNLRTEHLKLVLPLKNELELKHAELNIISTADKVNMSEVNTKLDEIGAIKLDMAKKRAAHRQDIRNLLTEEQRVKFDMHSPRHGKGGPGNKGSKGGKMKGQKMNKKGMNNR